jgi:hypothetical protein
MAGRWGHAWCSRGVQQVGGYGMAGPFMSLSRRRVGGRCFGVEALHELRLQCSAMPPASSQIPVQLPARCSRFSALWLQKLY